MPKSKPGKNGVWRNRRNKRFMRIYTYFALNYLFFHLLPGRSRTQSARYAIRHPLCCGTNSNIMERVCVYPQDIVNCTGKSLRYAQKVLQDLRTVLKKEKHQLITKQELAAYLDIDENLIKLR